MRDRWRGRSAGLALVTALVTATVAAAVVEAGDRGAVVVTVPDGRVLARVSLDDEAFTLRYRNSLYGTLAEERFVVAGDGAFRLDELAAEQVAVLEEYYAASERPMPAGQNWWRAPPAYELELQQLTIAATDLGERTLIVEGHPPLALWRLVDDADPSVLITIEGAP